MTKTQGIRKSKIIILLAVAVLFTILPFAWKEVASAEEAPQPISEETIEAKCKELTDTDILEGAEPIDVCTTERNY